MKVAEILEKGAEFLMGLAQLARMVPELDARVKALEEQSSPPEQDGDKEPEQGDGGSADPEPEQGGDGGGDGATDPKAITADPDTWPLREPDLSSRKILKRKKYDVDDVDRAIVAAVLATDPDDATWNEDRKKIAKVRRLILKQIDGLHAAHSRANGNGGGGGADPVYTHVPATWPTRPPKQVHPDGYPPRGAQNYDSDQTDLAIALAVRKHAPNDWSTLRFEIAKARQLTTQQVAELGARITRLGLLDAA